MYSLRAAVLCFCTISTRGIKLQEQQRGRYEAGTSLGKTTLRTITDKQTGWFSSHGNLGWTGDGQKTGKDLEEREQVWPCGKTANSEIRSKVHVGRWRPPLPSAAHTLSGIQHTVNSIAASSDSFTHFVLFPNYISIFICIRSVLMQSEYVLSATMWTPCTTLGSSGLVVGLFTH